MASSSGDNGDTVPMGRANPVAGDECESHHSRDEHPLAMLKRIDLLKPTKMVKSSQAAIPKSSKSAPPPKCSKATISTASKVTTPGRAPLPIWVNVLGLNVSLIETPVVAKKLLEGVIQPFDQEEIGKLDLNQTISKLLFGIGQVVVLASSLAECGRELRDGQAIEELKKAKKDCESFVAKLEKEIANL
ncbi:hypothetical protein Acr_25g0001250 [Actinidia rufa]|uniref:Uncharacterized protein n=1 Tax=Actinidia rufa TaxID=165716 RepID=A0A7J0GY39_9ERIC|nr:hypothetical protein Acr_25g0001250 [Actinidia rufa]